MKNTSLLASRKVVSSNRSTEDYLGLMKEQIPTAKVGTDEQEPHTEADCCGQGNTSYQRLQPTITFSRCGSD